VPNPKPRPLTGRMVPPVAPLPDPGPMRAVAPGVDFMKSFRPKLTDEP
jgi:hypothetical protein